MTHLTLNLTDEDSDYLPSFALDTCDMSYPAIHGSLAKLVIHKTKQYVHLALLLVDYCSWFTLWQLHQERTGGVEALFRPDRFFAIPSAP
jgi:hypothetical protein